MAAEVAKRGKKVGWKNHLDELNNQSTALPEKRGSMVRERSGKKYGR